MINIRFQRVLRITAAAMIVVGLQAWAFQSRLASRVEIASQSLSALRQEASSGALINEALDVLREYRSVSVDTAQKRQVLLLREAAVKGFNVNPRETIAELIRLSGSLTGQSDVEAALLESARLNLLRLQDIYTDYYYDAVTAASSPPFYLYPTAGLLSLNQSTRDRLAFNRTLYLALVTDYDAASLLLGQLRKGETAAAVRARAVFALARVHFDVFRHGGDADSFRLARELTQESLWIDPDQGLPKLFLEFLLSMDQQAAKIDSAPEEGSGSGESEGERGSLSSGPTDH